MLKTLQPHLINAKYRGYHKNEVLYSERSSVETPLELTENQIKLLT